MYGYPRMADRSLTWAADAEAGFRRLLKSFQRQRRCAPLWVSAATSCFR
jgi:hypothetical protein